MGDRDIRMVNSEGDPIVATSMAVPKSRAKDIVLCIPVYNDWTSAQLLLERIDVIAPTLSDQVSVLLVEDGSDDVDLEALSVPLHQLREVSVLRLRRNLGHQRAIAIGITFLYATTAHELIVVMDGDGEDRPEDIAKLVRHCTKLDCSRVVFARRAKRSEGLMFRVGYQSYRLAHRLLVGRRVEVGNFSVIPRTSLARLVTVSELWNHYAAAIYHARIPHDSIAIDRGTRIAGKSTMRFESLVMHGLSAVSVYSDVVGVRLLMFIAALIPILFAAMLAIVGIRLWTDLAIPGWATSALGILLVAMLNLIVLATILTVFSLRARTEYSFLPLRDYEHFILRHEICRTQATSSTAISMSARS
jgi:polyisoprenyl-phosphate glycosyltransferase